MATYLEAGETSQMDLRIFVEPQQGATYADQLVMARTAQDCGYSAFFRSDHFLVMGDRDGLPGPTDAWLTLAGLARETTTIRLGTLVTSVTFRHPGILGVSVAQVDQMSGGRVELGVGAGWFEQEHHAYGVPFGSPGQRFDLLEDTLEVITGMWATPVGQTFSYDGPTLHVNESPGLPKPTQERVPIVMGGRGRRRTPELSARFADEFNMAFPQLEDAVAQFARVDAACEQIGRDPASMTRSVALVACVGRDEAEVQRRADAIGREVAELRANGLAGTPDEVVDRLGRWREETGAQRYYLQMLDIQDLEHAELIAAQVVPQLT